MRIATYGFAEDQGRKLGRILRLSKSTPYEVMDFDSENLPDLLLLFGEEQLETAAVRSLPDYFHSRLIIVGKRRPNTQQYPFIGYPLVSSRVLAALDQLVSENENVAADSSVDLIRVEGERSEPDLVVLSTEIETSINEGSADIDQDESVAANSEPEKEVAEVVGKTYRVLVVDDSHPMQQALAKELSTQFEQLDIDFADEGLIALEMAEKDHYDFIFLDIMMPGIDGFETCTRMRAMEKLKKLPIIMLSSKSSPLDEVKGIMAGSSTYLTKPIEPEEFHKVISRIRKWLDNFS